MLSARVWASLIPMIVVGSGGIVVLVESCPKSDFVA
jgi:hypothetical protein